MGLAEPVAGARRRALALEVSSGRPPQAARLYPARPSSCAKLRARAARPITLASDAHVPENVGRDLDRAVDHAREAGYETVTVFDLRRRGDRSRSDERVRIGGVDAHAFEATACRSSSAGVEFPSIPGLSPATRTAT